MFGRYLTSIGGRVTGALAQTAVLALLARSLGVAHFGTFAVVLSTAQLVFTVLDLGFGARLLQLRDDAQSPALFGAALVLRAATVVVVIAGAIVASTITGWTVAPLLLATAVYATGEMLGDSTTLVFQGELKARTAMGVLLSRRLIALVPFAFGLSLSTAVAALVAAGLVGHAGFWPVAARRAGRPMRVREVIRVNGPIVLLTGGTSVTTADSLVVAAVATPALVSAYAAASRLSNPVNLAITTMIQVLIPEMATAAQDRARNQFIRARRVVALLAVGVAFTSLLSPVIVQVLYGPAFASTAPILVGVIIGAAVSAVSQVHLAYVLAHRPRAGDGVIVIAAVLAGLGALGTAAAIGGAQGCAIGYVLMELLILVGMYLAYRRAVTRTEASVEPAEA